MSVADEVQKAVELSISDITKRFKKVIDVEDMSPQDKACALSLFISRVSALLLSPLLEASVKVDNLTDILLPYFDNFRDILANNGHHLQLTVMFHTDNVLDKMLEGVDWENIAAGGYSN